MKTINIALLGFGTVARGAFDLLAGNKKEITNRTDVDITISKIYVRDPKNTRIKLCR